MGFQVSSHVVSKWIRVRGISSMNFSLDEEITSEQTFDHKWDTNKVSLPNELLNVESDENSIAAPGHKLNIFSL